MTAKRFRVIREPECEERTGLSRVQRWRLTQEGLFPEPFKLGKRSTGWLEHELENWIAARAAQRRSATVAAEAEGGDVTIANDPSAVDRSNGTAHSSNQYASIVRVKEKGIEAFPVELNESLED
jgi:prophage regulatory protein